MKPTLIAAVALSLIASVALAADPPKPAASTKAGGGAIPPGAEQAKAALEKSPRHGEYADIKVPGQAAPLRSYVVFPERKDKAPVVIVIHEIFGLTDWVRGVADQLAADGFIAIAPDLLSGRGKNGGGTESFGGGDDVRGAVRALKPDEVVAGLNAVREYGNKLPAASGKTATIGFCWGGAQSFLYAAAQPELSGAVVYYGSAPGEDVLAKVKAPVLGLYGQNDARITSAVEPTAEAMQKRDQPFIHHIYEGAGHGFLRQQDGQNGANLKASQEAWPATIQFLRENTKDGTPDAKPNEPKDAKGGK